MLGDHFDDVAIGVAVAVGVLPGAVHGVEDSLGWTVVVLVAGELHHLVVVRIRPSETLGRSGCLSARSLSEELGRVRQTHGADRGGDPTEELATRQLLPDVHETPYREITHE